MAKIFMAVFGLLFSFSTTCAAYTDEDEFSPIDPDDIPFD